MLEALPNPPAESTSAAGTGRIRLSVLLSARVTAEVAMRLTWRRVCWEPARAGWVCTPVLADRAVPKRPGAAVEDRFHA